MSRGHIVAAVLAALAAAPSLAQEQPAAGQNAPSQNAPAQTAPEVTRESVGDWTVICAASGSPCVMEQLGRTEAGETAISMQIERLAEPATVEGQQIEAVANFLVPLGSLLQPGLRVRVDSGQPEGFAYVLCQQNGCIVQAPVRDALLQSFRRGARATLTFAVIAEGRPRQVDAQISLSGFTRAYDGLRR